MYVFRSQRINSKYVCKCVIYIFDTDESEEKKKGRKKKKEKDRRENNNE